MKLFITTFAMTFALAATACTSSIDATTAFAGTWTWLPNQSENVTCGSNTPVDATPAGNFTITVSGGTLTMNAGTGCSIEFAIDGDAANAGSGSCATDSAGVTDLQYCSLSLALGNNGGIASSGYSSGGSDCGSSNSGDACGEGITGGSASGELSMFFSGTGTLDPTDTGCEVLSGDGVVTIALVAANAATFTENNGYTGTN